MKPGWYFPLPNQVDQSVCWWAHFLNISQFLSVFTIVSRRLLCLMTTVSAGSPDSAVRMPQVTIVRIHMKVWLGLFAAWNSSVASLCIYHAIQNRCRDALRCQSVLCAFPSSHDSHLLLLLLGFRAAPRWCWYSRSSIGQRPDTGVHVSTRGKRSFYSFGIFVELLRANSDPHFWNPNPCKSLSSGRVNTTHIKRKADMRVEILGVRNRSVGFRYLEVGVATVFPLLT